MITRVLEVPLGRIGRLNVKEYNLKTKRRKHRKHTATLLCLIGHHHYVYQIYEQRNDLLRPGIVDTFN